jgi:hypothetical protein
MRVARHAAVAISCPTFGGVDSSGGVSLHDDVVDSVVGVRRASRPTKETTDGGSGASSCGTDLHGGG